MNLFKKKNKYLSSTTFRPAKSGAGFTIIELIVCISIIGLISAIVFYNGRKFDDTIIASSAAQEASLAIREAQTYGTSVKESSVGSGNFTLGYGIMFATYNPNSAIVFKDINADKIFNGGIGCMGNPECVDQVFLRNSATITNVCATNALNIQSCGSALSATFIRPSLDATLIVLVDAEGSVMFGGPWISGQVTIRSPGGTVKNVTISTTGQISIQ